MRAFRPIIPLLALLLPPLLGLAACSIGAPSATQTSLSHSSQDSSEQRSVASDTEPDFMLQDREISPEELEDLASFAIIWPDQVPADCSLRQIAEMSESDTQSTGSGIFLLKYQCGPLRWFHIQETNVSMSPNLADYSVIAHIRVKDEDIPVHSKEGDFSWIFLRLEGISVEVSAQGLASDELAMIVTSLRPKQRLN